MSLILSYAYDYIHRDCALAVLMLSQISGTSNGIIRSSLMLVAHVYINIVNSWSCALWEDSCTSQQFMGGSDMGVL